MIFKNVNAVIEFCQIEFNYQEHKVGDFHRATGLAYSTIHRLVDGETVSPHLRTVILFLDGLGFKLETQSRSKKKKVTRNRSKVLAR